MARLDLGNLTDLDGEPRYVVFIQTQFTLNTIWYIVWCATGHRQITAYIVSLSTGGEHTL